MYQERGGLEAGIVFFFRPQFETTFKILNDILVTQLPPPPLLVHFLRYEPTFVPGLHKIGTFNAWVEVVFIS